MGFSVDESIDWDERERGPKVAQGHDWNDVVAWKRIFYTVGRHPFVHYEIRFKIISKGE